MKLFDADKLFHRQDSTLNYSFALQVKEKLDTLNADTPFGLLYWNSVVRSISDEDQAVWAVTEWRNFQDGLHPNQKRALSKTISILSRHLDQLKEDQIILHNNPSISIVRSLSADDLKNHPPNGSTKLGRAQIDFLISCGLIQPTSGNS